MLAAVLILPLLAALLVLLPIGHRGRWPALVTVLTNAILLALALAIVAHVSHAGALHEWNQSLSIDAFGALLLLLVTFLGFTTAIFSWGYIVERRIGATRTGKVRLYYTLYHLFILSMVAVPVISHVALVWIAVEMTTLMSAFLVAYEDTPASLEAAWKYVVLTSMGAILGLLGILILYWGTRVAGDVPFTWAGLVTGAPHMPKTLLWTGFLLILVGFGTKVGLVPLHTWLPDAHSQAPSPVCALLSGVETSTALFVILRLFPVLQAAPLVADPRPWFIAIGLVSVGAAAFLLLHIRDYKRMFAFSTVEHMGIIMVAVGLGGMPAHLAAMYQLTAHALTKSFCFFAAGTTLVATGTQEVGAVHGLIHRAPLAGTALFLGGLAIAGAPPFVVFISEFSIFRAGLADGQYLSIALLALFVAVAFCALTFHINRIVFGRAEDVPAHAIPRPCLAALVIAAIPMLILGLYLPGPLAALFRAAAATLGH